METRETRETRGKTAVPVLLCALLALGLLAGCAKATPTPISEPTVATTAFVSPVGEAPATRTVKMATEDNILLLGSYYAPKRSGAPGLVLLHMLGRQRSDWDELARRLQGDGYAVLAIDLRGHGESRGKREWTAMTRDAAAAWEWLGKQEEVDAGRRGLIGASIGANIALNFAADEPGVRTVILLSPGLDYHHVTAAEAMKRYGERPVLIVASSEDSYAADSSRQLDELARGKHRLQMYDGQGHGTQMLGKGNGLEELIEQWLAETL